MRAKACERGSPRGMPDCEHRGSRPEFRTLTGFFALLFGPELPASPALVASPDQAAMRVWTEPKVVRARYRLAS